MTIIGYKKDYDPDYPKTCMTKWVEYGSAERAAQELGVSSVSVQYNAWRWIIEHPEEGREFIDNSAVSDNRFMRKLTDEEYFDLLTRKALKNYTGKGKIESFVVNTQLWKYPIAYDRIKIKYPIIHDRYSSRVQR
jgi:hypothetical protein